MQVESADRKVGLAVGEREARAMNQVGSQDHDCGARAGRKRARDQVGSADGTGTSQWAGAQGPVISEGCPATQSWPLSWAKPGRRPLTYLGGISGASTWEGEGA